MTKKNGRKDTFLWILSISSSYLHGILFFEGKWKGWNLEVDTILKKDGRGNTLCTSVVCTWWRMYNLHLKEFTSAIIKVAEYVNLYMIKSRRMSRTSVHDKIRRMSRRFIICNQIFRLRPFLKFTYNIQFNKLNFRLVDKKWQFNRLLKFPTGVSKFGKNNDNFRLHRRVYADLFVIGL